MKAKSDASKSKILIPLLIVIMLIVFLTIAVVAIMFANGEKVTPTGIVKTGSIRIISDPLNVSVKLDGKPVALENSLINELEEGTYNLTISLPGYSPIEKQVLVKAGLVEDLPVKLFPTKLNLSQLTQTTIQSVTFSPSKEYAFYVVANSTIGDEMGIWRQRISDTSKISLFPNDLLKISNITPEIEPAIKANQYTILVSPDDARLILEVRTPTLKHYLLDATQANSPDNTKTLETMLNYPFTFQDWLGNGEKIVIRTENLLAQVNLTNGQQQVISYSAKGDLRYAIAKDKVFFFDANVNKMYVFTNNATLPLQLQNIKLNGNPKQIYTNSLNDTALAYINEAGQSYYLDLTRSYQTQIASTAIQIQSIAKDGLTVLYHADPSRDPFLFQIKEQKGLKKLESATLDLKDYPESDKTDATTSTYSADNLLLERKTLGLLITDRQGGNAVTLLDAKSLANLQAYAVNNSNSKIYLLLNDNLYFIDLR